MSTYYLAFRPYAELRSICQTPSAPSSLLLARSGWSNAGVYRAGPETDFFSFASGLSLEVQKMGAEINKCLSSKTSSFLLLLTSGGLVVYLLLRRRGSDEDMQTITQSGENKNVGTPSDGQPPNSDRARNASSRWSIASWLRWIFEDELLDGPGNGLDDIYVQGQYFGPAESKPNLGNETNRLSLIDLLNSNLYRKDGKIQNPTGKLKGKLKRNTVDEHLKRANDIASIPPPAVYVAPCPNCIRGSCKIRKHKQLRKYLEHQKHHNLTFQGFIPLEHQVFQGNGSGSSGNSNSSTGDSPLINKYTDSNGIFTASSTTPYNADDENSDPESEIFGIDENHFPYINQTHPVVSLIDFQTQLIVQNKDKRSSGDGEKRSKLHGSQSARKKTKCSTNSKNVSNNQPDINSNGQSSKRESHSIVPNIRIRVPPEGKERLSQTQPFLQSSSNLDSKPNLTCGNIGCLDSFCSSQITNLRNVSSRHRENSVDSLQGVSGDMVDLVKGAREVRRMIRETSMDSLCSDFSLNSYVGGSRLNTEDLDYLAQIDSERFLSELSSIRTSCDDLKDSLLTYPVDSKALISGSKSDFSITQNYKEEKFNIAETDTQDENITGDENLSPNIKSVRRRPKKKLLDEKKLWRLSAPMSDIDSPQHLSSNSKNLTAEEDSSLEWESPSHGWHDIRHVKYKMALHQSRSQSLAASDCEDNIDALDPWEWDSDGFGDEIGKATFSNYTALQGLDFEMSRKHDNWLPDKTVELDLESELEKVSFNGSINNSRRNSYCSNISNSDMEGSLSISQQVRLPPSGRSSVAKGSSPITGLTPVSSMDKDILMQAFLTSTINSKRTTAIHPDNFVKGKQQFSSYPKVPIRKSKSGSSLCNLSTSPISATPTRNSVYGKDKSNPPSSVPYACQTKSVHNMSGQYSRCSSEESGFQDFDKSLDSGSGNVSNHSFPYTKSTGGNTSSSTMIAGTPLSPVHEAKEPRASPITSPTEENYPLKQFINARRNLALDITSEHAKSIQRTIDEDEIPDLETISAI